MWIQKCFLKGEVPQVICSELDISWKLLRCLCPLSPAGTSLLRLFSSSPQPEGRGLSADSWWRGFGKQTKNKRRRKSGTRPLLIHSAAEFSVRFRHPCLFLQPPLEGLVLQAFTELCWGFSGMCTKLNVAVLRRRTMGCFCCRKGEKRKRKNGGLGCSQTIARALC